MTINAIKSGSIKAWNTCYSACSQAAQKFQQTKVYELGVKVFKVIALASFMVLSAKGAEYISKAVGGIGGAILSTAFTISTTTIALQHLRNIFN
jgi:hypothetical protein